MNDAEWIPEPFEGELWIKREADGRAVPYVYENGEWTTSPSNPTFAADIAFRGEMIAGWVEAVFFK